MSKYEKSSETYDAVYLSKKDYVKEAEQVHGIVQEQRKSAGNELLDVACGTGLHAEAFQRWYQVEGLDWRYHHLLLAVRPSTICVSSQVRACGFSATYG